MFGDFVDSSEGWGGWSVRGWEIIVSRICRLALKGALLFFFSGPEATANGAAIWTGYIGARVGYNGEAHWYRLNIKGPFGISGDAKKLLRLSLALASLLARKTSLSACL